MHIEQIPRHVGKIKLAGLRVGELVKTLKPDYSQAKNSFQTKPLPAGSVGRVKKIFDFGSRQRSRRFLCDVKFDGHPLTNFYTEELAKVRI